MTSVISYFLGNERAKNKWSLDLRKYAQTKKQDIDKVRKVIAFETYKSIVEKTPVDTGRARGNWQIGIGKDITEEIERYCPNAENAETEPVKLNYVNGDESIYISNNLPYIVALEYGHSNQAPQGMVGVTMAGINNKIEKYIRKVGESN